MSASGRRNFPALLVAIAATVLAGVGVIKMLTLPSSDVLGSAGRPEGWFGLIATLLTLFFLLIFRSYGRPRALKLATVTAIVMLIAGLVAIATLPPDCGQVGEDRGLSLSCLDVYGTDPEAAKAPSTWGIWLLSLGGFGAAAGSIIVLFGLAAIGRDGAAAAPRSRPRPPGRDGSAPRSR